MLLFLIFVREAAEVTEIWHDVMWPERQSYGLRIANLHDSGAGELHREWCWAACLTWLPSIGDQTGTRQSAGPERHEPARGNGRTR